MKAKSPVSQPATGTDLLARVRFHIGLARGKTLNTATPEDKLAGLCGALRELVMERYRATRATYAAHDSKQVYYLSMEYLLGRTLRTQAAALDLLPALANVAQGMGLTLDDLCAEEPEMGLGNAGLGRLAACLLDALATHDYPAIGYGLRYEHGAFRQVIDNGWQREQTDEWLRFGNPWEIIHPEDAVTVMAYGRIATPRDGRSAERGGWVDWQQCRGVPHDLPVPGYGTRTVGTLRLWRALSAAGTRSEVFAQSDYIKALEEQNWAEGICRVLYPSDNSHTGRERRLLQEYFLSACSVRDIVRGFQARHSDWNRFPEQAAIHLNDTQPALAVAELMRCLCDENGLPWETAWDLVVRSVSYTTHTLLAEAVEKQPVPLMERVLPRHMQIIYLINHRFLQDVIQLTPEDPTALRRFSLIEEGEVKQVRMAHLATVGSHAVNGVSVVHTEQVRARLLPELAGIWPERFCAITNGISQRRWLLACNPGLSALITERIGPAWIRDLTALRALEPLADDAAFRTAFQRVKQLNKERLAAEIKSRTGIVVDPAALFDVQIKRLHEYKRQLLNVLHIVGLYHRLLADPSLAIPPRVFVFAAKAGPSYHMAKLIIKLIHSVAAIVNGDARLNNRLKVVFLPDYGVSLAELIVPAADLSEQISTAGKESSGTGNMKLALNGALTIGTWDGANIELAEAVGEGNLFVFGHRPEELNALRTSGTYNPRQYYQENAELRGVVDALRDQFSSQEAGLFQDIWRVLVEWGDTYFHLADYAPYLAAQDRVSALYRQPEAWTRMCILNVSRMGPFSADRAVHAYAERIWGLAAVPVDQVDQAAE